MESYATFFSRFVAEAVIIGLRQGLSPDEMLEETGVTLNQLYQSDFKLPMNIGIYIIYRVYSLSKIPGVTLRVGAQMRPSDFGSLGLAMISAPTLGAALHRLQKSLFSQYFPWYFTFIEANHQSTLIINVKDSLLIEAIQGKPSELKDAHRYFVEVGLMMSRCSWIYAGEKATPSPLKIELDYPEPYYLGVYQRYFNCPVYFNQPNNQIVFRTTDLLVKPAGSNNELSNYSKQHLNVISRQTPKSVTTWSGKTRTILKHGGIPFLNSGSVAQRLNISDRVLRRHLAQEHTSYRKLLQQVREELARQYLEREELTIRDAAYLLGYSEPAAFSRSFKKWTGVSPLKFREALLHS